MRRIAVVGWLFLAVGVVALGMRTVGLIDPPRVDRFEMVSTGALDGDYPDLTLETQPVEPQPPPDYASQFAIVSVAMGILLVTVATRGAARRERRLIGT